MKVISTRLCITLLFLASSEARKSKKSKENVGVDEEEGETGKHANEHTWVTGNISFPFHIANSDNAHAIKLASFNLKQFGTKKSDNLDVLKIIAQIVSRYELIALQEITDVTGTAIKKLIGAVNQVAEYPYHYIISPRVGRNKQKEQYALFYRPDIFHVNKDIIYDDSDQDPFSREPHIVDITLRLNGENFGIINIHIAPKNAFSEINSLVEVHNWVQDRWRMKNILLMGDLNAACSYIRKKDIPNIILLQDKKYRWLITNDFDTTVGNTNCAYDRIIVSGPYLHENVVEGSPRTFEFDAAYGLDKKFALNVSDHYPIEMSLRVVTQQSFSEQIHSSGNSVSVKDEVCDYGLISTLISLILQLDLF